jgi:hypothetical protein
MENGVMKASKSGDGFYFLLFASPDPPHWVLNGTSGAEVAIRLNLGSISVPMSVIDR